MKSFVFITTEGFTYQPASQAYEPAIENCQVIGFGTGYNSQEAFKKLVENNKYLTSTTFNEIICLELANEERSYFYLDDIANKG